jgi:TolB-like protein/Flp pilus assembly protein TadD
VVLYEMATGGLPFAGTTTALTFDAILNREPVPLMHFNPALPPAFCNVVIKLLQKDCRLRYQTAADLLTDLRRLRRSPANPASATVPTARKAGKNIESLAVLPFVNATGKSELDYLGETIAEGLIDGLSLLSKLRVVPRSKAFRHRDKADDPQAVGRELAVRAVLAGRITERGDQLSIRAELIDVARDTQIWGSQLSCSPKDVLDVQEEISRCVSERLRAPSSSGSRRAKPKSSVAAVSPKTSPAPAPVSNAAEELFLRGNDDAIQWTPQSLQGAIELYQQAIDADRRYAPAYACMAIAHSMLTVVGRVDTAQALGQAKACARRAIELDESLSEAHAALSHAAAFCDFNLAEAAQHGERALELNPDSAIARHTYALTLAACGRIDEAVEQAREGCAIDPMMAPVNYCYGLLLYYQRRWDKAEAQLQQTLEIYPRFQTARALLGIVLARSGRFSEAIDRIQQLLNQEPDLLWELVLAYVVALSGDREQAEGILAQLDYSAIPEGAYFLATIYGALGEVDLGFVELERARDLGFGVLATAAVDPALDPFRADRRWQRFLRSIEELAEAIRELQGAE